LDSAFALQLHRNAEAILKKKKKLLVQQLTQNGALVPRKSGVFTGSLCCCAVRAAACRDVWLSVVAWLHSVCCCEVFLSLIRLPAGTVESSGAATVEESLSSLSKELDGAKQFNADLFVKLSTLYERKARMEFSSTLLGRFYNLLGYFYSLYCLYKIVICTVNIVFDRRMGKVDPISRYHLQKLLLRCSLCFALGRPPLLTHSSATDS
jgi:hypothetical protein